MIKIENTIAITILFLCHFLANAQMITGIVCDQSTKLPVSDVHVYLDGTSINTVTNILGKFELRTNSIFNSKLVLHHLSYETAIIDHPFEGIPDTLYIKERVKTIREVTIQADLFTRQQKMKAFREQFLGMTRAGKSCVIENEDDIQIRVDMRTRRLLASSDKPVVVVNNHLGYKISFILLDFWVQYGFAIVGLDNDYVQSSFFSVVSSFTDMEPDSRRMKRRRDNVYDHSSNYFFKSFANDALKDNKFILFNHSFPIDPNQYFSIKDTLSQKMISIILSAEIEKDTAVQSVSNNYEFRNDTVMRNGRIVGFLPKTNLSDTLKREQTIMGAIPTASTSGLNKGENMFYTGPKLSGIFSVLHHRKIQSDIYLMTDSFLVDRYGNIDQIDKISFTGQMGENRAGDMLPIDYEGVTAEIKQMTLTFHGAGLKVLYLSGTGDVTINWGDGTASQSGPLVPINEREWENLNTMYKYGVKHEYSEISTYIITISGTNITHLNCYEVNNPFTSLDVSKNNNLKELNCANNQLTSLDISKNTELITLNCMFNRLKNLDVSNNIKLMELFCAANPLTSLNLKKNASLTKLICGDNLLNLDTSGATALEELICKKNPLLTKLDVSKNTKLKRLDCGENQLTSVKISKNSEITALHCGYNQLSAEALNTLFEILNNDASPEDKTISIGNNPGTDACNQSIATDKGWKVLTK